MGIVPSLNIFHLLKYKLFKQKLNVLPKYLQLGNVIIYPTQFFILNIIQQLIFNLNKIYKGIASQQSQQVILNPHLNHLPQQIPQQASLQQHRRHTF